MNYCFIVNPHAGKKEATETIRQKVSELFGERGLKYSLYVTEYAGHAVKLAEAAAAGGDPVRICACGGDGTLNEVVRGAYKYKNAEFCVFPCGSGNDFIKAFSNFSGFDRIEHIIDGESKIIDLISINDGICLNICSVGIDAEVAYGIHRFRRIPFCGGSAAYNLSLISRLLRPLGQQLEIIVDGEKTEGFYLIAAIANGKVYGGGYKAAPEARLDDGLLDFVLAGKISYLRLAKVISIYKKGEHLKNGNIVEELKDCVSFKRVREISIASKKEMITNIDGETLKSKKIDIKVIDKAVRFVVPRDQID